jgi:hypothetical protein
MTTFFIVIGVFIAVVVVLGIRFDRRQRGLGAVRSGKRSDSPRMDNQTRGDRWGAGGS